jgi:membrane protein DedA with SNARE-associated domain
MNGLDHAFDFLNGHGTALSLLGVYVGTIFLGNIAAFASLLFAFQGGMGKWGVPVTFAVVLVAEVSADMLWYWAGRGLSGTRIGAFLTRHMPRARRIEEAFERGRPRLVFLSKFLYASNFPILFLVGWSKFDFKTFVRLSVAALACWLPLLFTFSYLISSGLAYLHAASALQRVEWLLAAGTSFFIAAQFVVSKVVRKSLGKKQVTHER